MFRGNHPATVDAKGRLKVPAAFLSRLREAEAQRLFVTSFTGEYAAFYPLSVWEEIEARLVARGDQARLRRNALDRANYYGHEVDLDPQGRVLLPRQLRAPARTVGKVDVLGQATHFEAWNHDVQRARIGADLSEEEAGDMKDLAHGLV